MDNHFLPIEPKKDTSITTKRQIERSAISKAIYMVTDLFEEGEPLKLALRNAAVDMLKDKNIEHMYKIKSLLVLSAEVGLISQMNADLLLRAIMSIEDNAERVQRSIDVSDVLKVAEDTSHTTNGQEAEKNESVEADEVHIIEPSVIEMNHKTKVDKVDAVIKKPERPIQPAAMSTTLDIGTRRKKILEVVRSKGQATIHEFIQSIQGCSSKTIQRELTSLVLSGTLKKTGERRWSKYSLR